MVNVGVPEKGWTSPTSTVNTVNFSGVFFFFGGGYLPYMKIYEYMTRYRVLCFGWDVLKDSPSVTSSSRVGTWLGAWPKRGRGAWKGRGEVTGGATSLFCGPSNHGCCWETLDTFLLSGLVVEIQPLNCKNLYFCSPSNVNQETGFGFPSFPLKQERRTDWIFGLNIRFLEEEVYLPGR